MSQPNPQSPPPTASAPPPPSVSEQVAVRLAKRARILDEGGQPYPVSVPRTQALAEVRAAWGHLPAGEETDEVVSIAGRVMFQRNTGILRQASTAHYLGRGLFHRRYRCIGIRLDSFYQRFNLFSCR